MDDSKVGKGSFIYITVLTVFLALSVFVMVDVLKIGFNIDWVKQLECKGKFGNMEAQTLVFILMMNVFVIWNSVLTKGWARSMAAFVLTFLVAFTAEALGVAYGLVFGRYYYTEVLGIQILRVPLMVALAWEPILYASFCLTEFLIPTETKVSGSIGQRIIPYIVMATFGGIATTAWDLMLDPFAVDRGWWVWIDGGPYVPYLKGGVPISNYFGWFKVAFVCQLIYRYFMVETGIQPKRTLYLSVYGPLMLYAMLFFNGYGAATKFLQRPEVGMVGLVAMGGFLFIACAKLYLLKKGFRFSPADEWLMKK